MVSRSSSSGDVAASVLTHPDEDVARQAVTVDLAPPEIGPRQQRAKTATRCGVALTSSAGTMTMPLREAQQPIVIAAGFKLHLLADLDRDPFDNVATEPVVIAAPIVEL
jgi:hypothetical protein